MHETLDIPSDSWVVSCLHCMETPDTDFPSSAFAGYIKVYAAGQLGLQHVSPQWNIIQKADKWSVISTSARNMQPGTQVSLVELLWTEILPVYFKGFPC